jgi:hypothetical protein
MQPNQQSPTSLSASHVLDIEVFQASQPSQVPLFQSARLQPVLRIRDIFVRAISGSVTFKMATKNYIFFPQFFSTVFLLITF